MARFVPLFVVLSLFACDSEAGTSDATSSSDGSQTATGQAPADILKLCKLTNACSFGPVVGAPVDVCVDRVAAYRLRKDSGTYPPADAQIIERLLACAETATTCGQLSSCATLGHSCNPLPGCDGDIAIDCDGRTSNNVPLVNDCAAFGQRCSNSTCVPLAGAASCAAIDGETHCADNSIVECVIGAAGAEELRRACASGTTCVDAGEPGRTRAYCLDDDAPTCAGHASVCDGDTLVTCMEIATGGFREVRVPCAPVGQSCGPSGPTAGADMSCLAPTSSDCSPRGSAPTSGVCDGDDIVACVYGKTTRISCADYGLTTCGVVTVLPFCQ